MGFRFGPLLMKFQGFEIMPFAFALLVGLIFICLLALQRSIRSLWIIAACLQIGIGLIYPIFLPVSYILVGVLVLLLSGRWVNGSFHCQKREILLIILGQILSLVICATYYMLITQDQSGSGLQLAQSGRKAKTAHLIISLIPFLIASLPFLLISYRQRAVAPFLLLVTGIGSMMIYLFADMGENEYKFILAATIMFAPLSAKGLIMVAKKFPQGQWAVVFSLPIVLVSIFA